MDENAVIYRLKERLIILNELALDYEVQDMATGAIYIIDKTYFRRKYEAECTVGQMEEDTPYE